MPQMILVPFGVSFKVWDYTGALLYEAATEEGEELWQVMWQPVPDGVYGKQKLVYKPTQLAGSSQSQTPGKTNSQAATTSQSPGKTS